MLAIAEYVRVVEDSPGDWNTANTLGDLYARAGQPTKPSSNTRASPSTSAEDGFYPKAAPSTRRSSRSSRTTRTAQLQLGEISARSRGCSPTRSRISPVGGAAHARGDRAGAAEIVVRSAPSIPPTSTPGSLRRADARGDGRRRAGAARFRRDARRPAREGADRRRRSTRCARSSGSTRLERRGAVSREGGARRRRSRPRARVPRREQRRRRPALLLALAEIELRAGDRARDAPRRVLTRRSRAAPDGRRARLVVYRHAARRRRSCASMRSSTRRRAGQFADARDAAGVRRARPRQIPALLKLSRSASTAGSRPRCMRRRSGSPMPIWPRSGREARVIAEDLVAREPWEPRTSIGSAARWCCWRVRPRHAHRRAPQRPGAVHGARSVLRSPPRQHQPATRGRRRRRHRRRDGCRRRLRATARRRTRSR